MDSSAYEETELVLVNEGGFHSWFIRWGNTYTWWSFYDTAKKFYHRIKDLSIQERWKLHQELCQRWLNKPSRFPDPSLTHVGIPVTIQGLKADGFIIDDIIQETSVSKLSFKVQFLLNATDIATLSNAQIYAAISAEESRIKDLEKIENKPKSLVADIDEAKANITKLVAYLDAR